MGALWELNVNNYMHVCKGSGTGLFNNGDLFTGFLNGSENFAG